MAAASPSPLASSAEKTNGAKLSRLLVDGGTTVLRNVFDRYHPPVNLAADLNANYLTLNALLRKRVLRPAQWDQLFPPGGATPDSKTFDVTLLFLLLTNICGLSPPLSGWHTKPPLSDTSLEANLARIKFFRNELYGHVSTTSVDSTIFTSLWQEISAVLVALGLNQAEIDRLKAEHCGEEGYLDVLRDWAHSEEDIKSQVKDIRQYQTETQQYVDKVLQIQLEDRETLEDNKSKLEEVHQIQTKTQQDVGKVHQTQLVDRVTLQDNKLKLEELHQVQTETQESVEAVKAGLQEIRQVVGSLTGERDTDGRGDEILRKLAKSEFKGDIEYHFVRFQEGTREWVFNKVQNWLDDGNSQNRVMVISANAGMGKSVISAVICKRVQEVGRLSGSHFCQHNNARYRNPQLMLQSLACHLCHALPKYKQALVEQLSRNLGNDLNTMGTEELFALLFKEPLSTVADPGRNMLMVIDALDESEYQGRNELLDVIADHFCKLPVWIRFLVTTRPERDIAKTLKLLQPFQMEPNDEKNVEDIKLFCEKRLQHAAMKLGKVDDILEKLTEKSEGLMLYAYFLVSFLEENVSVLDQEDLDRSLPLAISSVYHSYFKRLEKELMKEHGVKDETFLNLLCIVTASREPLPIDFVSNVLVPDANSLVARRKVLKAMGSVSSLLPIRDGCLHVIHKSVKDWLTDTLCYGDHEFTADEKEGHRILATFCSEELDNLKKKGVRDAEFSSTEKYALQHGVRHMLQLGEYTRPGRCSLEECVQTYVTDLELLYVKLCLSDSLAAEDILWLQRQEVSQGLSEDSKSLLNTLIFLLRKYFNTFADHPRMFFQTVLNEGGTVLSPVASNLLQNKYTEIPYMEFVHKQTRKTAVQAHFDCSSEVACLDVSPQSDYMVCECKNGTIQLWSLHTSKLVWKCPVKVTKLYVGDFGAYRRLPSSSGALSFYRSVVFHPTANIVLPGVLSHAYTFDGDLEPLFPESKCRFTVCSISEDKTTILTDCPDNAKCIIMWSLTNGSEITRTTRSEDVLSFALSRDGKLLAISYSGGSISIVDAKDGFRTLAQTSTPGVCGMIRFSPDRSFVLCWHNAIRCDHDFFRLNIETRNHDTCSLNITLENAANDPRECESISEGGFLLGDPFSSIFQTAADGFELLELAFGLALNKQTVITGHPRFSYVELLNVDEIPQDAGIELPIIDNMAFTFNGDTIYGVSDDHIPTVMAWNVSAEKLKAKKGLKNLDKSFVPVKDGVLLISDNHSLEKWNVDLSECVRSWTDLSGITQLISMSEERAVCVKENEAFVLDTATGKILITIPTLNRQCIACNSKYHLLTADHKSIQLLDDRGSQLWQKDFPRWRLFYYCLHGMFSPSEQLTVILANTPECEQDVYVLDASTGSTIRTMQRNDRSDCKFVSDELCVTVSIHSVKGLCLQLINVKSGDLLSEVSVDTGVGYCLAVCLPRQLVALSSWHHRNDFKLIQLHLPREGRAKVRC